MIWSLDGEKILWSDGRGVMAYDLTTRNTDLLQANNYDLPEAFEVKVYRPIDWSPNGRFLRLDEFHYEGGLEVILDTQTRQLFEIPNTWSYEGPEVPHGIWLSDSRFLLVRPERESGEFTTIVEIWRPSSNAGQLILDDSTTMPTGPQAIPKQPFQFPDGALAIGILGLEPTDPTSGLYHLETLFSTPEQLNQIPDVEWIWYGNEIFWEPDGSGIIIEGPGNIIDGQYEKNEIVYISTGETTAYDMVPIIGRNILQFYWLP
jgi:hypothetical protein